MRDISKAYFDVCVYTIDSRSYFYNAVPMYVHCCREKLKGHSLECEEEDLFIQFNRDGNQATNRIATSQ